MYKNQKLLTDKLLLSEFERYPVSLFHGKMGISIFFYHLSKIESNADYHSKAELLLDQILQHDLSPDHSITVEDGLAGIGLGVTWMIKNRFFEGDLNEMLEGVDETIYRKIIFQQNPSHFSSTQLLHLTGYLYIRLKEQTETDARNLYQDLIIKVLNLLYKQIDDKIFNESYSFSIYHYQLPVFLWIISKLLDVGFYNDRIYRMLDTLQSSILSRFPVLHSNRLFLLWGMVNLAPYIQNTTWNNYIQMLYREINLEVILNHEMNGRKIFMSNGLSMAYLLMHSINSSFSDFQIPFDPQKIFNRLNSSDAWNALMKREYFYDIHHGLLNGFPGVLLVLSHIKHNYLIDKHEL